MNVPFTQDQFFDVLGAYNSELWPFVLALWIVSVVVVIRLYRQPVSSGPIVTMLLAVHWAWTALAYHAAFFTTINPAASAFAAMSLLEAALLIWSGLLRHRLHWSAIRSRWQVVAWMLVVYGLLYPVIARAEGHAFPRLPTFGVPCPTTILTIGLLIAADQPMPRLLAVIPITWAIIGGQAAFLFGVRTDLMLLASGIIMLVYIFGSRSHSRIARASSSVRTPASG